MVEKYLAKMQDRVECPYIKHTSAYDPARMKTWDGPDVCTLVNDKPCLLYAGLECDTWNEIWEEMNNNG